MSENAMSLLLKLAKETEYKAQLALLSAQQELQGYYLQVQQIEQYRLDYSQQMSTRGQVGLSASSYGHLNRFIVQLDETLVKQRQAAIDFEKNVEHCREHWQQCREKTRAFEWLIEKRLKDEKIRLERLDQKQMDEFAMLSFIRRKRPSF